MASGLQKQPYAASSRMSVIARYQDILDQGFKRNICLPRSGPWAHRIVNQRKALPKYRGRTEHTDIWNMPEDSAPRRHTMSHDEWEDWHDRHAACEVRCLSSGHDWLVPSSLTNGYAYISKQPSGSSTPNRIGPSSRANSSGSLGIGLRRQSGRGISGGGSGHFRRDVL